MQVRTIFCYITFLLSPLFSAKTENYIQISSQDNCANHYGYGVVPYNYQIGKFEVTNQEYCAFLNCVATKNDKYKLYQPLMSQHFMGGIIRMKTDDGYIYKCKENYEHRPVVCVTWMSAIRYINWLHYNAYNILAGVPLSQWLKCTEGDATHGAYNTQLIPETRNKGAIYWLPNRSEWEKAAYFDGEKWLYDYAPDSGNYYDTKTGWAAEYPHITEVGRSEGVNGTFDQQGNAAEWIENSSNNWKLALGGSLIRPHYFSYLGKVEGDDPNKAISSFGYRICKTSSTDTIQNKIPVFIEKQEVNADISNIYNDKIEQISFPEYVRITDAGNIGDRLNQYKGAVGYEYYISRTELSNSEYCAFLNSVATADDPFSLYHENMENAVGGGIVRQKTVDGYSYHCKEGWENRPVVYISYYDLARYANWLHYGSPNTGNSTLGTTEGDKKNGAYDTSDFELVRTGQKNVYRSFGLRNRGARFWIPSDDEWYKAAYYDPTISGNRKYYDYPTCSNEEPTPSQANYMVDNTLCVGEPYFVAPVDSFSVAASHYETLQQGGNVWEWTEDWQYGVVGCRGLRGGSWSYTSYGLNASNTDPGGIDDISYVFGGRICKAVDENGWQPVAKPLLQSIYEYVILLPKSRIIFVLAIFIMLVIYFIVSLVFCISRYCNKHRS